MSNMKLWSMLLILIFLQISFVLFQQPIMKGFIVLIYTYLTSILIIIFLDLTWFSLILLLTFLGGILVIFMYVISIIENTMLMMKFNLYMLNLLMVSIITLSFMNFNKNFFLDNLYSFNFMQEMSLLKEISFSIFLFSYSQFKSSMIFVVYLFLTMICLMKIIYSKNSFYKF